MTTAVAAEEEVWDSIVIGSGMGGLSVASLLAQCRPDHPRSVLVLEQHPTHAGGCCQAFEREGYRFGVGVHFVAAVQPHEKGGLKKLVDVLTPEGDPIEWSLMPDMGIALVGKDELKNFGTGDTTEGHLIERFPEEKQGIQKFFAMARKANDAFMRAFVFKGMPRWMTWFLVSTGLDRLLDGGFRKYARMSVADVVRSLVKDPDLRMMLEVDTMLYGMTPEEAPFIMHSVLFAKEFSASYPTGGPGKIPEKISKAIKACGGDVLVNASVASIIIENRRAVGVQLADGRKFRAKQIISDAGYVKTLRHFVPPEHQPRQVHSSVASTLADGMTGIVLYVGLQGSHDDDFGLPHSISVISDNQLELHADVMPETLDGLRGMKAEDLGVYVTCPSAKDGSWKTTYPGKTTLEILLPYVPWKAFQDLIGDNGEVKEEKKEEYERFKREMGQLIWTRSRQGLIAAGATEKLPEHLEDADFFELGTPLTYHRYLGSDRGAWYGLEHGRDRFRPRNYYLTLRPDTGIPGLYLTGQDVCTDGVTGALFGGYLCAGKILGVANPVDLVKKASVNRAKAGVK